MWMFKNKWFAMLFVGLVVTRIYWTMNAVGAGSEIVSEIEQSAKEAHVSAKARSEERRHEREAEALREEEKLDEYRAASVASGGSYDIGDD